MVMKGNKQGYFARIKAVLTNLSYISLVLSLCGLFFGVTGVQYWFSDYLKKMFGKEVLGEEDGVSDANIALAFSITCFTAPIMGAVVGGVITAKMGGYNTERA